MSDILEILRRGAGPKDVDRAADEITRLRADLAAVTEERNRLREALRPIAFMARAIPVGLNGREKADYQTVDVTCGDLRRARAALEGVTEPPR